MSGRRRLAIENPRRNERQRATAVRIMATVEDGEAAMVWLDPQYRAVLDKQPKYQEDWQARDARHTKIRIAKQRLALKLAGLHQEKLVAAMAR